jgi:hypothetical protein
MKLDPLMTRVAVAGKVLTDAGLTLQLPAPKVFAQLKSTVPVKPSCEEIEIEPLVPVVPAFTLGKALDSVRTKVGFSVTANVNEVVKGDGAPEVAA